jgi:hypothetical protein
MKSGSRVLIQNLFCNFLTLLQVYMKFGRLKQFLELKIIKNDLKTPHSVGPQIGPRPASAGGTVAVLQWQAAGRARLIGRTGRSRDPTGSDGVRGERDRATRC